MRSREAWKLINTNLLMLWRNYYQKVDAELLNIAQGMFNAIYDDPILRRDFSHYYGVLWPACCVTIANKFISNDRSWNYRNISILFLIPKQFYDNLTNLFLQLKSDSRKIQECEVQLIKYANPFLFLNKEEPMEDF